MNLSVMSDQDWQIFFKLCAECLEKGGPISSSSGSWCAWTTYRRIGEEFGYWSSGLPSMEEIRDTHIADGACWGQPFSYSELAHVVIPRTFYWEVVSEKGFESGLRTQDIDTLSAKLNLAGIEHRVTNLVLEIKLY